jgi:hypothetical protein
MKRLIATALLLALTVNVSYGQTTVTKTVTWTAPAVDATHSAPAYYVLQWHQIGTVAWTAVTPNPTATSAAVDIPTGITVECRVMAVDASGGVGPWSLTSDPYTSKVPGGCGKPVWN